MNSAYSSVVAIELLMVLRGFNLSTIWKGSARAQMRFESNYLLKLCAL